MVQGCQGSWLVLGARIAFVLLLCRVWSWLQAQRWEDQCWHSGMKINIWKTVAITCTWWLILAVCLIACGITKAKGHTCEHFLLVESFNVGRLPCIWIFWGQNTYPKSGTQILLVSAHIIGHGRNEVLFYLLSLLSLASSPTPLLAHPFTCTRNYFLWLRHKLKSSWDVQPWELNNY